MICITERMTGTEIKYGLTDSFFTVKAKSLEKHLALDDSFSREKSPLIILTSFHDYKKSELSIWYKKVHNKILCSHEDFKI